MKVLVVFDHPRRQSFCGSVLDAFVYGLAEAGHEAEIADLHQEHFDPRSYPADEPDWSDATKVFSDRVMVEQARVDRYDALAFVFPVWWWSMPAMTKGWIDRVWNNGWAYGPNKLKHEKALMIGVAATDAKQYTKRGYDVAMRTQLVKGILAYCGIENGALEFLHESLTSDEIRSGLLARAKELGRTF